MDRKTAARLKAQIEEGTHGQREKGTEGQTNAKQAQIDGGTKDRWTQSRRERWRPRWKDRRT